MTLRFTWLNRRYHAFLCPVFSWGKQVHPFSRDVFIAIGWIRFHRNTDAGDYA